MDTLNTFLEAVLDKGNMKGVGSNIEDYTQPYKFLREYEYLHPNLLVNFFNEMDCTYNKDTIEYYSDNTESGKVFLNMMLELKNSVGEYSFMAPGCVNYDKNSDCKVGFNLAKKLFKEGKWVKKLNNEQMFVIRCLFNIENIPTIKSAEKLMIFYDGYEDDDMFGCVVCMIPPKATSEQKKVLEFFFDECAKRLK